MLLMLSPSKELPMSTWDLNLPDRFQETMSMLPRVNTTMTKDSQAKEFQTLRSEKSDQTQHPITMLVQVNIILMSLMLSLNKELPM